MKKYNWFLFLFLLTGYYSQAQRKGFVITGTTHPTIFPVKKLVLSYTNDRGVRMNDTFSLKGDRFSFSGALDQPMRCRLTILPDTNWLPSNYPKRIFISFAMGNEKVYLDFRDPNDFTLTGSKVHTTEKIYKQRVLQMLAEDRHVNILRKNAFTDSFILAYPTKAFSLILLKERIKAARQPEGLPKLYEQLPATIRTSRVGQELNRLLEDLIAVKEGSMAPDFSLKALDGSVIQLSALRGKFVFLDFWASWCIPCRKENPNVVKAFHQLKSSNIVFIGISLDGENEKEAWEQAIEKDGLVWAQISELKDFESPIAQLYKVTGVPRNFLIDPKGKIISTNLKGENLAQLILNYMQKPGAE